MICKGDGFFLFDWMYLTSTGSRGRRPAIFLYINKRGWKCGLGILSRHCCKSHDLVVSSPVCVHGHVVSDSFFRFSPFPDFYQDTFSPRLRVTTWECVESGCPGILPHSLDSMTSLCMSAPLTELLFFFGNPAQKHSQNLCTAVPVVGFNAAESFGFTLEAKTSTVWLLSPSLS